MKKLVAFLSFCLLVTGAAFAQSPVGVWKTIDDETGLHKSDVEIYEDNGKLYGKIIALYNRDPEDEDICTECSGDLKDQPLIGLKILRDLQKDGDEWNGGKITDPKNGKNYKCYISSEEDGAKLKVRGFIGFSLIGRTQYWHKK